jgi:hypothetical protein
LDEEVAGQQVAAVGLEEVLLLGLQQRAAGWAARVVEQDVDGARLFEMGRDLGPEVGAVVEVGDEDVRRRSRRS